MQSPKSTFYLFPLVNVNLFPATTKPLQIFEERYIQMIQDSIEQKTAIALCFVPEGSQEMRPIAGYGYPQIIESRHDGTLIVFINCIGKVQLDLTHLKSVEPYLVTDGQIIEQDVKVQEPFETMYVKLSHSLVRWVRTHVEEVQQQEIFIRSLKGPQEVVSAFSAYLVRDYDMQYELMQIHSINDQIQFLYRLLESGQLTNR